jgi:hypothetical protein
MAIQELASDSSTTKFYDLEEAGPNGRRKIRAGLTYLDI